jgi:DNA-binding IclR family transcriptional regulator
MPATLEDLNIVLGALTSCKTKNEIVHNVKLPADTVDEVLEHLRKTGRISKDEFTDTFCPIEKVAGEICQSCSAICDAMKE